MENTPQIHINHPIELFERHFLQACILRDARVVHQHVDAAELVEHSFDGGIHHVTLRDIHHKTEGLCARGLTLRHGSIDRSLFDITHDDDGAFVGEFERSR